MSDLESTRVLVLAIGDELPELIEHLEHIGAQAHGVSTGGEAFRLLSQQGFDLLLVDLAMPGVDVADLIAFVRQQPRTRHLPVIVLASPNESERLDAAFDAGAGSVLMKPLHWLVFEHHIDIAMRMVAASGRLRAKAQQSIADSRAKSALLGNVCAEARASAGSVRDEVDRIWRSLPATAATPVVIEALRRIGHEVGSLKNVAARAEALADELGHVLTIVDRREPIAELIERALDMVELQSAEKGVRLVSDLPREDIVVFCDPAAFDVALRGILLNAIEYSPSDSNVSISASLYPDGLLAIDVTDEGEGMHPEYVARCLTPLKSSSIGGVSGNGRLGFGLPLAKAIMEAHDGALEIRSMPGEGTTALLVMPAERVIVSDDVVRPS